MKRKMYVIQREDGQFYWKGHVSSQYGYTEDFGKAHLFQSKQGASTRLYTARPMGATVKEVEVTLKGGQQ